MNNNNNNLPLNDCKKYTIPPRLCQAQQSNKIYEKS